MKLPQIPRPCRRLPLLVAGLGVLLAGCGGNSAPPKGYPPPGQMRVVSTERLDRPEDSTNLIRNGDLAQWWAGAPVPNGFSPAAPESTKVVQVSQGGRSAMLQSWSKPDAKADASQLLRAESAALEQGKHYLLEITSLSAPASLVSLSLWAKDTQGGWQLLEPDFLTLEPGKNTVKTYRKSFMAKLKGTLLVTSSSSTPVPEDNPVAWIEWRLSPAGVSAT